MDENLLAGTRILLVEDSIVNQEVARATLESFGCKVVVAENGIQAVEAIAQERFDLILMDCLMPGMDGFTATRAIRQQEVWGSSTPIVALSGDESPNLVERTRAAGMDDLLTKPFTTSELYNILALWLNR